MDGVAVELVYEDGVLTVGSTRGDGVTGENVTAEHPHDQERAAPAPRRATRRAPKLLEVRGEVYLPIEAFRALNREREEAGQPVFANPRNSTRRIAEAARLARDREPRRSSSSATASATVDGATFATARGAARGASATGASSPCRGAGRSRRSTTSSRYYDELGARSATTCRSRSTASSSR